jgi:Phosphatidylinositol 3- and 4-kinase
VAAFLLDRGHFSGVPATTFVEVVHKSLKYVPFTGLEVNSDAYFETMSSLIKPVNLEEELALSVSKDQSAN